MSKVNFDNAINFINRSMENKVQPLKVMDMILMHFIFEKKERGLSAPEIAKLGLYLNYKQRRLWRNPPTEQECVVALVETIDLMLGKKEETVMLVDGKEMESLDELREAVMEKQLAEDHITGHEVHGADGFDVPEEKTTEEELDHRHVTF